MRIGLVSSAVPFISGGGRFIVDWLLEVLVERGHEVEVIYIPSTEEPDHVIPQMAAFAMIKLDGYFDRVITFRPPAHMVNHPNKVVWFIHHIRMFYDLWDSEYNPLPDNSASASLRKTIIEADTRSLSGAHRLFTNSKTVSERIKSFNGLSSEVLYPPVIHPERFKSGEYGNEIVCVCRLESHKRQHLLVEALGHTKTPVRLRLCGKASNPQYPIQLLETGKRLGISDRLEVKNVWITEEEKALALETALASAYVPFDEDSYGYPTIEAGHAQRCTVTLSDAGGVPEFVIDGENGFIVAPHPAAIAEVFDRLFLDRVLAKKMGQGARARIAELGIDWDTVVAKILA